jgi:adsorption protein B
LSHFQWVVACLAPLAFWILLSGLDDLFVALVWLIPRRKQFPWPADAELDGVPERRIAILVPLWNEHRVIGPMLERNLASIRYSHYDIFAGVYPNDGPTARAVAEIARRYARVHAAMLPHDGPTSKGDCLNWIWQGMRKYEARHGVRFEIVMTHDAEDLVHAESLRLVNWFSRDYQMVQIPVLALATGWAELTHGIYCDEFAEFQQKDIPVRQRLGGFLPSNGVGTGFDRAALERLAATRKGRAFDSECLTEDYENGYCLHQLGYRQLFVPLRPGAAPVATREYFPRRFRAAVRQRSRWVAGIALQGWKRHGWGAPRQQIYWLWRDRKGLVGNLLSPLANVLLCYGLADWRAMTQMPHWLARFCAATLGISVFQMSARAACTARIYGWRFATGMPLRIWWGNLINALATAAAIWQFAAAERRGRRLNWRKTEHIYPAHALAATGQPRLGEALIRLRCLSMSELDEALRRQPRGMRLGEYLLQSQKLSEQDLYQALSLHAGVELGAPGPAELSLKATRTLPLTTIRRWKVMPYRIDLGQLHLLTPEVPTERMTRELAHYSALEPRFRLVRPSEFERLMAQYYGAREGG